MNQYADAIKSLSFRQWVESAGVVGLFIFAFGMLFKKGVAHAGILLMTIAYGFSVKAVGKDLLRDRLLLLSVGFFVFLLLRTIFASFEFPEYKPLLIEGTLKLFGAGFFLVFLVAFWMHRARIVWDKIFIAILIGFLVQVLSHMEWSNLTEAMHLIATGGKRATFGFATNRFGLFSALLFLACLLLYPQLWGMTDRIAWHRARIAFWCFMLLFSVWGLVFSQSRSAWFATILVIPVTFLWKFYKTGKLQWKPICLITAFFIAVFMIASYSTMVEKRLDIANFEYALSMRFRLYQLAWERWQEHPMVGQGPGTSRILIQAAGDKLGPEARVDHFHNLLIDILVQVGIVGLAFYALCFFLIARQARHLKIATAKDRDYILFALSGMILILLTGVPNQPLSSPHGVYLIGFLGGICYSFKFASTNCPQTTPSSLFHFK